MSLRPIFASLLLVSGAFLAGACAKRAEQTDTNAPGAAPPPADQAPAQYGQPGYQGTPPPGGTSAGDASQGLVQPKAVDEESAAYASIADAEKALDQANGELAGLTGASDKKPKDKTSSTSGPAGRPAAAAKPDTSGVALAQGDPRCDRACKAFSSLRRAADGVCRLAGESDTRCSRARGIVKDNETRVTACKCDAGG